MVTILDVSNNQGPIVWDRVAAPRLFAGVYAKASEGVHFNDAYFRRNRADAARAGLHVGAYHYAHPEINGPMEEADHFLHAIDGHLHDAELVPALDLEQGTPRHEYVAWARAFNRRVHATLGVWPLFYSYPSYIGGLAPVITIGGGLWLASYAKNDGRDHPYVVPHPWRRVTLHQFSSRGRVAGVNGLVDLSHAPVLKPLLVSSRRAR